ncbi:hypothetical protein ACFWNR_41110 [Streptomyces virginiae]|uniref:hypothetical protein n=1 Tax=Streptomyces virginiae TaxID=1961 RepID=UPI00364AD876
MTTTLTAPHSTEAATQTMTAAQEQAELGRLRRQRDALFLVLLLGIGAVLAAVAGIVVRLAPSWANPAQVALGTLGAYIAAVALLVPILRRRQ